MTYMLSLHTILPPSLPPPLPPSLLLTPVVLPLWSAESTATATAAAAAKEAPTAATGGKEQTHTNALGQRTVQEQIQGQVLGKKSLRLLLYTHGFVT